MWWPDYQNKKLNFYMFNSFKGFHLFIKQAIMWDPDNQLMRKRNFYMLLQANKSIPCNKQIRTQNMY